jgi:hypothetical protein
MYGVAESIKRTTPVAAAAAAAAALALRVTVILFMSTPYINIKYYPPSRNSIERKKKERLEKLQNLYPQVDPILSTLLPKLAVVGSTDTHTHTHTEQPCTRN